MINVEDVQRAYDQEAEHYDDRFSGELDKAEEEYIFRYIKRRGMHLGRVADMGCGTGLMLRHISTLNRHLYIGLDISEGMLNVARRRHPGFKFAQGDIRRPGFNPGSISNLIYSYCPLSYLSDEGQVQAIAAAHAALRPGGRLLAVVFGPAPQAGHSLGHTIQAHRFTSHDLLHLVSGRGWEDQRVHGVTGPAARAASTLVGRPVLSQVLDLEASTLGVAWPNICRFLILEAKKRS